ncbi:tomoregulin-2-like [Ostrea edulis]|uniref:tomoregulin-2-like n=1 Tax=Ostrea edulis TaxID=37623 RepID=UPI002094A980|nr:tomoregulin-2-like [Ostrea edulis]
MKICLVILCIGFASAQHGHGHNGGSYHPDSQTHIDTEIENMNVHFGKHQCLDLLLVDCQHHVTNGDEMICGSNGVTYDNHCKYVHAACMFVHLTVAHTGACSSTTVAAGSTSAPAGTTAGNNMGSAATGAQTTMAGSTQPTSPPTTTLSPEVIAFQNVFCRNKDSIMCPSVVTPLCGSDGTVYNSSCHLSKARCDNHDLHTVDGSTCGLTTPVSVAPIVG